MPRNIQLAERAALLRRFVRVENRMPTYEEMAEIFKYRSKNAVAWLVDRLEEAGYVRRDENRKLSPTRKLTSVIVPVGEVITAGPGGFPSPADEELVNVLSLDDWLVRRKGATFLLRVRGDSMKDAGILDGDAVLVERNTNPANGSIVAVRIDGELMVKYLVKDKTGVTLESANPNYKPIRPQESLEICGLVVSVCRKLVK